MVWVAPYTATTNDTLTAAEYNGTARDDFFETEVAKAAIDDDGIYYIIANGANSLVARRINSLTVKTSSAQTTTSTSYVNLTTYGPSITCVTGTTAMVWMTVEIGNETVDAYAAASYKVSGATTLAAQDDWALEVDGLAASNPIRQMTARMCTGLTAGTNTFTMVYRQSGGTGMFQNRHIVVHPL